MKLRFKLIHQWGGDDVTAVRAYLGEINVGGIKWRSDHEIDGLWVEPDYRRQGIATALYEKAQGHTEGKLKHSPYRTREGDAWARSVGGYLPPSYTDLTSPMNHD